MKIGESIRYNYTGAPQPLELPIGVYKFEVYGAQGGGPGTGANYGGFGGLSVGVLTVLEPITLYMYIGGTTNSRIGGWNGGGTGAQVYGGGGGTDIALYNGAWNSREHLYSRLIVAGGGGGTQLASSGGSSTLYRGGQGGGEYGGNGIGSDCGFGGGPTYGGASRGHYGSQAGGFGYGGGQSGHQGESIGCGGGGWYGGSSGGGYNDNGSGGGGSGYVFCASKKHQYPAGCLLDDSMLLAEPEIYGASNEGHGYIVVTCMQILDIRKNSNMYKDAMQQEHFDFTKIFGGDI